MKLQLFPYVTLEIDERLRRRVRFAGERLGLSVRAYLRSAADDVDAASCAASDKVRGLCERAVNRVDSVVASVNDKIAPTEAPPRLHVVGRREAS